MHREAAGATLGCGLPEPAALDDREQDRSHPLGIVRARVIRRLRDVSRFAENLQPQIHRAPLRLRRQLVDRRLDRERIDDVSRRAPGAGGHAGQRGAVAESRVRNAGRLKIGVELLDGPDPPDIAAVRLGRVRRARILAIHVARATGDDVVPRHDVAVGVDPGAQPLHGRRTIVVVLQIALAVVDDHHGAADRLCHHARFRGVVREQAPAESAADACRVDVHLVGRQARGPRHDGVARSTASAMARECTGGHRGNQPCSCAARASRARRTGTSRCCRPRAQRIQARHRPCRSYEASPAAPRESSGTAPSASRCSPMQTALHPIAPRGHRVP